jgi:predicted secreted acid phosphatase
VAGERLVLVLDLDETLFFNWPHISDQDFGYVPDAWQLWVDAAKAPAIEPVREVYRTARTVGADVIFITGRPERDRTSTLRNLEAIGCADFVVLVCKPEGVSQTSAAFKTAARERFTREGWTIIANVGDQESDLTGGFAERTFKLPNPFYLTE